MLTVAQISPTLQWAACAIPTLPFLAMLICGGLAFSRSEAAKRVAGYVTVAAVAGAFLCSLVVSAALGDAAAVGGVVVHYFEWINIGPFTGNFSFFIDALTIVMLMVVTGIGTLIAVYAMGYMAGDPGYARFFSYIALFIFAMTSLVMADNLLLLYLGWEGVGAASYLLIGYYYRKPTAAAAAKKAFIVNRIGDFGFALGLMGIFLLFGSVEFTEFLPRADEAFAAGLEGWHHTLLLAIPFLLMLGAFGKSAQLPLHVWLPDAMEGPTPVSALIHAATMVTAGVYMIARLINVFQLSPWALPTVAVVGGVTALFAATIALCQYDIKRIWAYSTVSQLGFMFLGVGVLATTGAIFHLFTHAFFKALLFLTAGSVMHALAGQLDLRNMSGLYKKMPVTAILMLIGCLALAGVPFTSGFYSKDMILSEALLKFPLLGWLGIATALITAFYTFRLWFRVFVGETRYEMGNEHHGYGAEETVAEPEAIAAGRHGPIHHPGEHEEHHHAHEPHEMPWWPMNGPLVVLAMGALFAGLFGAGYITDMIGASTAAVTDETKAAGLGLTVAEFHQREHSVHTLVSFVAGIGALLSIGLAALLHWKRRDITDRIAAATAPIVTLLYRKYFVDELYDLLIVRPLRGLAWVCYAIFDRMILDRLIIDTLLGRGPRAAGAVVQPTQQGVLQGYARLSAIGLVIVMLLVAWKVMA